MKRISAKPTMSDVLRLWDISKIMRKDKEKTKSDNVVLIYGLWRSGKSNLGMKLIENDGLISKYGYMRKKPTRRDVFDKNGKLYPGLNKPFWDNIFRNHYANSAAEMAAKIKSLEKNSVICVDEGIDVAGWHQQMTAEQSDMIHLLQKTGKLGHTTIFITPSRALLTKNILQRAKWMMIIPGEHDGRGNYAHLYRNYKDPARAEKNPFGLNYLFEKLNKFEHLSEDQLYTKSNRYRGTTYFRWISPKIYDLYEAIVKDPHMFEERKMRSVPYKTYIEVYYALMTMVRNLRVLDEKKYTSLRRLATTKFGEQLIKEAKFKEMIDTYDMLEKTLIPKPKKLYRLSNTRATKEEGISDSAPDVKVEGEKLNPSFRISKS